jgi:hypothetical protein
MSRLGAVKRFRETGKAESGGARRGSAAYKSIDYYADREIWQEVSLVRTAIRDERSNYEIIDEALKEWAEKRKE